MGVLFLRKYQFHSDPGEKMMEQRTEAREQSVLATQGQPVQTGDDSGTLIITPCFSVFIWGYTDCFTMGRSALATS